MITSAGTYRIMTYIFEYRGLIGNFVKRDISQKYAGSPFGLFKRKQYQIKLRECIVGNSFPCRTKRGSP